jgi:rhodanese-related sulfurtransferase
VSESETDAPAIGPAESLTLMREREHVYVDVRTVPEFDAGHPEGAYNIPWREPDTRGMRDNPDFLRVAVATFARTQPLIVGCQAGGRARAAARALLAAGYAHVLHQAAGYGGVRDAFGRVSQPGWQAAGLPTAIDAMAGRSYAELCERLRDAARVID